MSFHCVTRRLRVMAPALGSSFLFAVSTSAQIDFSHDNGTLGVPVSAVNSGPDVADIFRSGQLLESAIGSAANTLQVDMAQLGLVVGDNLDALSDGSQILSGDGIFDPSWVFSVYAGAVAQAGTPINVEIPDNGADLYRVLAPFGHGLVNQELQFFLDQANPVESIDALELVGIEHFERIYFSLAPGSVTLANNGWSAADVLTVVVGVPALLDRAITAAQLGLLTSDDLDGLIMWDIVDADSDGRLQSSGDYAFVEFSVNSVSVGLPQTDVRAQATGNGADGDIFWAGLAGDNYLEADNVLTILEIPTDGIDALAELHSFFGDPPYRTPGPLPNPPPPPMNPPYQPPFCGLAGIKLGFCGALVPGGGAGPPTMKITIKLCDDQGNRVEVMTPEIIVQQRAGTAKERACDRAEAAVKALAALKNPKPGFENERLFPDIRIVAGNAGVFTAPGIEKTVCAQLGPTLPACDWVIDKVCFSGSIFTRAQHGITFFDPTAPAKFPELSVGIGGPPGEPGILRLTFSDADAMSPTYLSFAVPFAAGTSPAVILGALRSQIRGVGGVAFFVGSQLHICQLPVERPFVMGEIGGPFLEEIGSNSTDLVVLTEYSVQTARCNPSQAVPAMGPWTAGALALLLAAAAVRTYRARPT